MNTRFRKKLFAALSITFLSLSLTSISSVARAQDTTHSLKTTQKLENLDELGRAASSQS